MPFESEDQRRYMWAKHPQIAKRWAQKYGNRPHNRHVIDDEDLVRGYQKGPRIIIPRRWDVEEA